MTGKTTCGILVAVAGLAGSAVAGGEEQWGLGWNSGGPWRPTLVSTQPAEIDAQFFRNWDDITGHNTMAFMPPAKLFAACWDPKTPPTEAQMAKFEQMMRTATDEMGLKYEVGGRWTGSYVGADGVTRNYGSTGDPITITWSFVPDGLSILGYNGEATAPSNLFAQLDAAYASQGGRATWISRFQNVFDRWAEHIGVTYVRIAGNATNADADDGADFNTASGSATRGQVRIGMHLIDGASGVLAYNFFPGSGTGGNMVLDSGDTAGFYGSITNVNRRARNIIAHEHGHGLGLSHVCPIANTKLMEPFLSTAFDTLRQDDVRGGMLNYGDASEPDGTIGTARNRGSVNRGAATVTLGVASNPLSGTSDTNSATLSLHRASDVDFHRFTPTQSLLFNATVTPKGSTYSEGPQTSACNTGTSVNTLNRYNLAIQVQDAAGNVIAEASSGAAGATDTVSSVFLTGGVDYYVRVYPTATSSEVQLYNLSYSSNSTAFSITASDGLTNGINVSWTGVAGATSYQVLRNSVNSEVGATLLTTVGGTVYFDSSAEPDGDYYYFVRVTQGGGPARTFGVSDVGWRRCTADVDSERGVSFGDFLFFFNCFDNFESCADVDGVPGVDFGDFLSFFNAFDQGC